MTKDEDFKLLKIQTCVLRVNIDCDGCRHKVKKLLQRIEGVYSVKIEAELQKVTVSGSVDSATLIKKLFKSGKHAELWSQKGTPNQKQKTSINNSMKDEKSNKGQQQGLMKGLEAFKNQHKFPSFSSEEDDEYFEDDDDEEDVELEEDGLRLLRERANQLGLLQLQQQAAETNKKNAGAVGAHNGKKGGPPNQNQNMGIKAGPGGIDQRTIAALKMNNPHNPQVGNETNPMLAGLSGFQGNNRNPALGGGGVLAQPNTGFPSSGMMAGNHPTASMMMMNNNNSSTHPSAMMMNRMALQQQPSPQMMYHRSPYVPPTTGYYYNYNLAPYSYMEPHYPTDSSTSSTSHMSSDENANTSCSIM